MMMDRFQEKGQVRRIMRNIGIHFKNQFCSHGKRLFESFDVCSAQSELFRPVDHLNTLVSLRAKFVIILSRKSAQISAKIIPNLLESLQAALSLYRGHHGSSGLLRNLG